MKGKVALMTIFNKPNYGSVLQTFATVEILKDFGYNCDVIDYVHPNEWHYDNGAKHYNKSFLKKMILWVVGMMGVKKGIVQKRRLKRFISKHFSITKKYADLRSLELYDWTDYKIAIAGSDQIWSPKYLHGDKAFMLSFIPDNIKKVSIASSFGTNRLPNDLIPKYKKYLSRFSYLTTREPNGKRIINELLEIENNVEEILDPTLLLDSKQWLELLKIKDKVSKSNNYLLLYYLNYSFESAPYIFDVVKYLSKKYRLKIKVICGEQSNLIKKSVSEFVDCSGSSIEEFVSLFAGSKIIITSSFHGTAFAVNFGKPLISVIPSSGDDRQKSLLDFLDISHCAVSLGTDFKELNPFYDNYREQEILSRIREKSLNILKSNLMK